MADNFLENFLVRIKNCHDGITGAGFLLDKDAVVTCAHVVRDAIGLSESPETAPSGDVFLDFPYRDLGKWLKTEVHAWDKEKDVAVLRLKDVPPAGVKPAVLFLEDMETLRNHSVRVLGAPKGHDDLVESVDWRIKTLLPGGLVQLAGDKPDIQIQPGFSGTPVFDEEIKKVAGMISSVHRKKTAFMIPAATLLRIYPIWQKHEEDMGVSSADHRSALEICQQCLRESFAGRDKDELISICDTYFPEVAQRIEYADSVTKILSEIMRKCNHGLIWSVVEKTRPSNYKKFYPEWKRVMQHE